MNINKKILPLALAFGLTASLLHAQDGGPPGAAGQPPPPPAKNAPVDRFRVHLLPPGGTDRLELTPDQYQQIVALEVEVKAKLEKILTPDQIRRLQRMDRRRLGGFGGPGRPRGPGGPDGPGANGAPPQPPAPPQ
jgi:hypothetical protein